MRRIKHLTRFASAALAVLGPLVSSLSGPLEAQPARTFILGDRATPWEGGGGGIEPPTILNDFSGEIILGNDPEGSIEYFQRPGWISPLFFTADDNIAARVLSPGASITAPNAGRGNEQQLEGSVNLDHEVAFQRKPTLFEPRVLVRGIKVILDFGNPVGVQRVRFYPRNTVESTPSLPFHNDFMRGYELWVNQFRDSATTPDILVARDARNESPVVDIEVPAQYVRFLALQSIAEVPFEIDEIEVYGTGYLQSGRYLTDLIDLGERATIGPVRWSEETVGNPAFSKLGLRVRSGTDPTLLFYGRLIRVGEGQEIVGIEEVSPDEWSQLERIDRDKVREDPLNWSSWFSLENGSLLTAPNPRRYVQFELNFSGRLFDTRRVGDLEFDYLQPPIADSLVAEVYPRLAQAEEPATFRYAVRLRATDTIRGFDRLEVDTNVPAENIRQMTLNGEPYSFEIESIGADFFALTFPRVRADGSVLEFTFDLPIFRFGTTFSGRAFDSRAVEVPQGFAPGDVVDFGPGDFAALSGLAVAIPRPQIGKLVGEIVPTGRIFTPNGDGTNDRFELFFNLLQLLEPAPVRLDIYGLDGRRLHTVFRRQLGIGPVTETWDGRLTGGQLVPPGLYVWELTVSADAFAERHRGTLAVVY
jgi:hypothetical protein